ncbi:MAG: phosphatase PAP2 family protein [Acidobacteria bacterium]|nr:phosphatase PAP2 family protein [Acidobacteriota bacterium]
MPRLTSWGLLLWAAPLIAQPGVSPFSGFLRREARIWTTPARLDGGRIPWLILAGAGAAALVRVDSQVSKGLPDTPAQLRWGTRFSRSGGVIGAFAIGGGLYAAGAGRHDEGLKGTGLAAMEAVGHSLVLTYGLKALAARERPRTGSGRGSFLSGYDQVWKAENSFPSGHSMQSWALAAVVSRRHRHHRIVPWLAYAFASMVSVSRVAAQRHFLSDVAVGAGCGYLIGRFVERRLAAPRGGPPARKAWLKPDVQPALGMSSGVLTLRWSLP